MKIKLHSHCYFTIIFIIFLSFLFSACGDSSSEKSGENPGGNIIKEPEQRAEIVKGPDVVTALEEAQQNVSQGATITIVCQCGNNFVIGKGEDEDSATILAQKNCTELTEESVISECEPMTATPST